MMPAEAMNTGCPAWFTKLNAMHFSQNTGKPYVRVMELSVSLFARALSPPTFRKYHQRQ